MPEYLKLSEGKQRSLLEELKLSTGLTWNRIAELMKVHKSTLYLYLNDRIKIPKDRLELLCRTMHKDFKKYENLETIQLNYNNKKIIKRPNLKSINLAEFCGILLGDGCIYSGTPAICISGHKIHDKEFLRDHVRMLYNILFGVKPYYYENDKTNEIRCIVNSKSLTEFLISNELFVSGKKNKNNAKIPDTFFEDINLLKACLRGISDTDASICPHPNTKVMYHLTVKCPELFESVLRAFEIINFPIKKSGDNIYFYGEKLLNKFFLEIGSSNPKHFLKWKKILDSGKMPRVTQLNELLDNGPGRNRTGYLHLA